MYIYIIYIYIYIEREREIERCIHISTDLFYVKAVVGVGIIYVRVPKLMARGIVGSSTLRVAFQGGRSPSVPDIRAHKGHTLHIRILINVLSISVCMSLYLSISFSLSINIYIHIHVCMYTYTYT